jgi:hypothetical protein
MPSAAQSAMPETEEKKKSDESEKDSGKDDKKPKEKSFEEQLASYIVTGLTGASGISALNFLHNQEWVKLGVAAALTAGFGFLRAFTQGFVGKDGKQMGADARKQLAKTVDQRRKPGLTQRYREAIETYCYQWEIEGEDAGGLTLEEIYVALRVRSEQSQRAGIQRPGEIWKFLPTAGSQDRLANRRLVILAPPGYGKTTLMRHVALIYASGQWRNRGVREYLPVMLRFREIHSLIRDDQPPKLANLIASALAQQPEFRGVELKSAWLEQRLSEGHC